MQQELPPHSLYQVEPNEQKADAVAYAALAADGKLVRYPYKYLNLPETEVRIQVTYTGLCATDGSHVSEQWFKCNYPIVPGHEMVGRVEKIGAKVTRHKVGDLVAVGPLRQNCSQCDSCKKGNTQLCDKRVFLYDPHFGSYSTHIQVPEDNVYQVPKGMKEELIAPLLCAGVSTYAPLKRHGKTGSTVAIIGIGGLGHLAIQYAVKLGMIVTAFTSSFNKEDEIKALGASKLSSSVDLASLAKEAGKYNLVLNFLHIENEDLFLSYQKLTSLRGVYCQVGAPPSNTKLKLDMGTIVMNQIKLCGSSIGNRQEYEDMLNFSNEFNVYPICEHFAFEDFQKAFDHLNSGKPKFRCVVNIGEWARKNGFHK